MKKDLIKEELKNKSPLFIRKLARLGLKKYREIRNAIDHRILSKEITEHDLLRSLRNGGVREGDVLLVHSSLSRLGYIQGGSQAVVNALLKAVGPKGTIGAPTFWGNTSIYQGGDLWFDVRNTPTILGKIAETIRLHPQARRSLHPTHSAVFIGPLADYLTRDHHLDHTPVGPNSPYMRLTHVGGKILLLGVTVEYMTNFHTIEDLIPDFPFNVYLDKPLTFHVIDQEGNQFDVTTFCHCPETGNMRQTVKMEPYFREHKVLSEFPIAKTSFKVLDAKKLHETLKALYESGITMYKPEPYKHQ